MLVLFAQTFPSRELAIGALRRILGIEPDGSLSWEWRSYDVLDRRFFSPTAQIGRPLASFGMNRADLVAFMVPGSEPTLLEGDAAYFAEVPRGQIVYAWMPSNPALQMELAEVLAIAAAFEELLNERFNYDAYLDGYYDRRIEHGMISQHTIDRHFHRLQGYRFRVWSERVEREWENIRAAIGDRAFQAAEHYTPRGLQHPATLEPVFPALSLDMDLVRQILETRPPVMPKIPRIPKGCQGCKHLHGRVYGENLLVCGMHPHGQENCSDRELRG